MRELRDFFNDDSQEPRRPDLRLIEGGEGDPRRRKIAGSAIATSVISAVAGGLIGGLVLPYLFGNNPANVYRSSAAAQGVQRVKIDGRVPVGPVTAIAQKLQPSIVNISIRQSGQSGSGIHSDPSGSVGSGVILSPNGYIITNNHVVKDASEITVTIGTDDVKGSVIGADEDNDLAIVKVPRANLAAAEFGSSKNIKVGDLTVAIGSPFGYEHSVTSGIVSGLNRTVDLPEKDSGSSKTYTNMIQTDASINPGNSGGALADDKGRVIGINALIMSNSGVSEGVGFAIPVETVLTVANQLIEKGKAAHPYMGITGQNLQSNLASRYSIPPELKGAFVAEVATGSPASRAGLRSGDLITSIDGVTIRSMSDLMNEVRRHQVGEELKVDYVRGDTLTHITILLTDRPKK